ncbi:TPA: SLATT domain-containing protein [Enterobacter ludwigii]|uniref:SLATT domain-containing protein n=1 Tax=Enterobacter sp. PTB TaxID=3143437 RepID=UPI000F9C4893
MNQNLTVLLNEVDEKILKMKAKVKTTKRKANVLKLLSLSFAALTTILVGISNGHINLSTPSLITSALLTLTVGLESHFSYQEQWERQKWTLLKLYQIQNKLRLMGRDKNLTENAINLYIDDYLSIWDMDLARWEKIKSQEKSNLSS